MGILRRGFVFGVLNVYVAGRKKKRRNDYLGTPVTVVITVPYCCNDCSLPSTVHMPRAAARVLQLSGGKGMVGFLVQSLSRSLFPRLLIPMDIAT